jgi:hypothetical protein
MSWVVVRDLGDVTADVHVLPVDDTRPHDEVRQCWCRPRVDEEGGHPVIVHNSADGREYFEPDHDEDQHAERPS